MKNLKQRLTDNARILREMPVDLEKYLDSDDDTKFLLARLILSTHRTNKILDRISNNVAFFFWVSIISIGLVILLGLLGIGGLTGF